MRCQCGEIILREFDREYVKNNQITSFEQLVETYM